LSLRVIGLVLGRNLLGLDELGQAGEHRQQRRGLGEVDNVKECGMEGGLTRDDTGDGAQMLDRLVGDVGDFAGFDDVAQHNEEGEENGQLDKQRQERGKGIDFALFVELHGELAFEGTVTLGLGLDALELGLELLEGALGVELPADERPKQASDDDGEQDDGNAEVRDKGVQDGQEVEHGVNEQGVEHLRDQLQERFKS
jgi:hypothetical protein